MRNFRINAMTVLVLGLNVAVVNATDGNILNITTTDPDNANKIIEATNVKGRPGHTAVGQQNQIYSIPDSENGFVNIQGASSAIGNQNVAKGYNANAVGIQNDAYGAHSQSFGSRNRVYGDFSMGFGAGNMIGAQPPRDLDGNNKIPAKDIVIDKNTNTGLAFGINNIVLGNETLALGLHNYVNGANSMAVGSDATSNGFNAIALGTVSLAGAAEKEDNSEIYNPIAIGYSAHATATETIAIGSEAKASADDAVAIGKSATSTSERSTALGDSANAKDGNSVALGSGTITREATQENEATVNGIKYSGFAGHDPLSVVSVGSDKTETYTQEQSGYTVTIKPHTRQIINVGAGKISATSTDAINGSQLYMIAEQVGKNKKLIDNISTLSSSAKVEAGDNIDVETHDDANQVKTYKVSTKKDIKANSYTINNSSIKIDQNGINAGNKKVINVANGENDNDAVNVSQLLKTSLTILKQLIL